LPLPAPDEVRAEIRAILAEQPHEVFARLAGERGQVLADDERRAFARQALARLIARVEVSNNRWNTLSEVCLASPNATAFDADIREPLTVLVGLAERRAWGDALFEVRHLSQRGKTSESVRRAQEWLKRLREREQQEGDRDSLQVRREVHTALAGIVDLGREGEALAVLQEGLRGGDLSGVAATDLPSRLHDEVQGLRGLKKVQELAGESRLNAGEIAALKQSLDSFTRSLRIVPEADTSFRKRILQDLAVRHLLQGHTAEYRALMPTDGSPQEAARLLRDLKALTLGKGEVVTTAARQTIAGNVAEPPAGVRAVLPESSRKNWRPPQARATTDRSPLEKAVEAGALLRERIQTDLTGERIKQEERTTEVHRSLEAAQRHLREREASDDKRLTALKEQAERAVEAKNQAK
jgi:hypothetical protein